MPYLEGCGDLKWSCKCWVCHGKHVVYLSGFGRKI